MPLYSATCPLPKNKAAKRQQIFFPERMRITRTGFAANFFLTDRSFSASSPYVLYFDDIGNYELFIEGTSFEFYAYNTSASLSSGQIPRFTLPSSLTGGFAVTSAHTTPTLAVSISQLTQSKVYDGQQPSLSFTSTPSISSSNYSLSSSVATPGTYTISLVESSKTSRFIWDGPYPSVSYTITKRPVTLTMTDRAVTYSPSGTPIGQVLSGSNLVSGDAQNTFSGLLLNLPTAVSEAGTYTVSINPSYPEHPLYTISGYTGNKTTATVTVSKATPTISFSPNASGTAGTNVTLSASTSPASLPVTFSIVSGGSSANISGGNILNFTGAGSVVVRASTASTTNYNAATSADRTITVSAAPSEGIPQRITTVSNISVGPGFGAIEVGKEYTSFSPLTGNYVELGGTWGWSNYVRSTTTVGGGTTSGDIFTSYLSKNIETYNGNRTLAYVILNPRHALIYHYENYAPKVESDTWVLAYIEGWSDENGDGIAASIISTNPSADPLNFPTSGWTDGFQPYVQMARDISVTYKYFYNFNLPPAQRTTYTSSFVTTTLQKHNTLPKPEGSGYSNNLISTYSSASSSAKGLFQNFYARFGYPNNGEYGDPDNDLIALVFGCYNTNPYVYGGYADYNGTTDTISNYTYDYRPLLTTWALTSILTYYHNDGSGGYDGAKWFYNVPSNTNRNVLPPAAPTISSPTWRVAGGYPNGLQYPTFKSYLPNYSESPIPDILLATGSMYSYLNREWSRQNIGDPLAFNDGNMIYLSSGLSYRCGNTGYHLLSPGTVLKFSDVNNDDYPYSGGFTAYTSSSSQWRTIWIDYSSDYGSHSVNEAWFTSIIGGNASRFPFGVNFTHPPAWNPPSTLSFAAQLFY
jgi:hypothetical protein